MNVVWTPLAHKDRERIFQHISADNPAAAVAMDEMFVEKSVLLADYPNVGRIGRLAGTRELIVHRNYIVIYQIKGKIVQVVRVVHAAQLWPRKTKTPS